MKLEKEEKTPTEEITEWVLKFIVEVVRGLLMVYVINLSYDLLASKFSLPKLTYMDIFGLVIGYSTLRNVTTSYILNLFDKKSLSDY